MWFRKPTGVEDSHFPVPSIHTLSSTDVSLVLRTTRPRRDSGVWAALLAAESSAADLHSHRRGEGFGYRRNLLLLEATDCLAVTVRDCAASMASALLVVVARALSSLPPVLYAHIERRTATTGCLTDSITDRLTAQSSTTTARSIHSVRSVRRRMQTLTLSCQGDDSSGKQHPIPSCRVTPRDQRQSHPSSL